MVWKGLKVKEAKHQVASDGEGANMVHTNICLRLGARMPDLYYTPFAAAIFEVLWFTRLFKSIRLL